MTFRDGIDGTQYTPSGVWGVDGDIGEDLEPIANDECHVASLPGRFGIHFAVTQTTHQMIGQFFLLSVIL